MVYSPLCIVGGGAIGGLISMFLYRGGVTDITVYYRSWSSIEAVEREGGILVKTSGREYLISVKPRHYTLPGDKCDIILNCVKAVDVKDTIDLIRNISHDHTLIVSLQNGFGSLELLEEKLGYHRVACGVVNCGALRVAPSVVEERGIGEIIFGQRKYVHPLLLELAEIIRRGGCPSRVTVYLSKYRWLKLSINAVINPLTAITRSRNSIVLTPWGREIAYNILEELVKAAELDGVKLELDRLYRYVLRIAKITSNNYSSMLQDILHGKITEIDYINGVIVEKLEKHGLEARINKLITNLIHLIEHSTSTNLAKT